MTTFRYKVGDNYPNIEGTVTYAGSVNTELMTAEVLADGANTGSFTGAVTMTSFESEGLTSSSFKWEFDVLLSFTASVDYYKLELRITHSDGSIETLDLANVQVEEFDG